jgi:hypothetical protein
VLFLHGKIPRCAKKHINVCKDPNYKVYCFSQFNYGGEPKVYTTVPL